MINVVQDMLRRSTHRTLHQLLGVSMKNFVAIVSEVQEVIILDKIVKTRCLSRRAGPGLHLLLWVKRTETAADNDIRLSHLHRRLHGIGQQKIFAYVHD